MNISFRSLALAASVTSSVLMLSACGGVNEMTKQRVARSETAVNQAQATLGNSEAGAIELQQAKDYYAQARKAVDDNDERVDRREPQLCCRLRPDESRESGSAREWW